MSRALEATLALLYVDEPLRERFMRDPRGEAGRIGLSAAEIEALAALDLDALEAQAQIMTHKRRRLT